MNTVFWSPSLRNQVRPEHVTQQITEQEGVFIKLKVTHFGDDNGLDKITKGNMSFLVFVKDA